MRLRTAAVNAVNVNKKNYILMIFYIFYSSVYNRIRKLNNKFKWTSCPVVRTDVIQHKNDIFGHI